MSLLVEVMLRRIFFFKTVASCLSFFIFKDRKEKSYSAPDILSNSFSLLLKAKLSKLPKYSQRRTLSFDFYHLRHVSQHGNLGAIFLSLPPDGHTLTGSLEVQCLWKPLWDPVACFQLQYPFMVKAEPALAHAERNFMQGSERAPSALTKYSNYCLPFYQLLKINVPPHDLPTF